MFEIATDLMSDHDIWIVGVKELIELSQECDLWMNLIGLVGLGWWKSKDFFLLLDLLIVNDVAYTADLSNVRISAFD